MDFHMKRKNLKPISRRQNYFNNFKEQDQVFNRFNNNIVSGNVQIHLHHQDILHQTQQVEKKQQQQLSNIPLIQMTKSVTQRDKESILNSKKIIEDLHHKVLQNKHKNSFNSEIEIQNQMEVNFENINGIYMNLSQSNNKLNTIKLLLEKVQTILGLKQAAIVDDTLKKLMSKELLKDQAKIYVASKCLITSLIIIKFFNKKDLSSSLKINPFIIMNDINKGILQYLKSKYPRNKNLFVPAELQSKFDKVNYLTIHQNNMLVNVGITFTQKNASRTQVLGKTKKFLNLLMEEVNTHFHDFQNLLNKNVLSLKEEKDLKLNKIKIGRKIPQNTEKFYQFTSQSLEISSPQLFRVMIKWIQSMQELLMNPSKIIAKTSSMKYIKKSYGQSVIFDEIQSRRFQDMKIEIIEKITNMKEFKMKISQLIDKLNTFNNNFARTLDCRSPSTKFIKEQQAETLKFAKSNTKFLEWLIVQKFLIIIKTLSDLSSFFETKYYKKLDFINFNVFDLMRASFSGKKGQILQVFQNLKKLDYNRQIELVRIKNRLNTPLNDVMINFRMKESFIICELQLILVDNLQEGQEKLKMMEDLNHIIYELQRSPYGSLSEMALIMGYYDPTIYYENKIKFKSDWDFKNKCRHGSKHQFQERQDQETPFVCSWCVKFYGRFQNFFQYHQCVNCSLQKCKACVFEENPYEEKRIYFKYFASCFMNIPIQVIDNQKDDDFIDNFFIRDDTVFVSEKYEKLRDQIQLDGKGKVDLLETLLYHKQTEYGLKATQPFYALLLHFYHGKYNLRVIKYVNYEVEICSEEQKDEKILRLQKHDALFFLRKRCYYNKQTDTYLFRGPCSNEDKKLINIVNNSNVKVTKQKNYDVVYIIHNKEKYMLDLIKVSQEYNVDNLQAIKTVLGKKIQKCESYKAERNCFEIYNLNIKQHNLQLIFSKNWVGDIKVLNLAKNRIQDTQNIFKHLKNIKEIYVSGNCIKQFQIPQNSALQVVDISSNQLLQMPESIHNAKKLLVLKASQNYISKYPKFQFISLEELDLSLNQIKNLNTLFMSNIRSLEILNISFNRIEDDNVDWNKVNSFPLLRRIQANKINLKLDTPLKLKNFPKLEYIDYSRNEIYQLETFTQKNLRQVKLYELKLKSLHDIFTDKLINLQILELYSNHIEEFPFLQLVYLQSLKLNNNMLQSIQNIKISHLPKLKSLDLQFNKLQNIDPLGQADLPHLNILLLKNNKIKALPKLDLPSVYIINLTYNKIEDISKISESNLPQLKQLLMRYNKIEFMPKIDLPKLIQMNPCENKIKDISKFNESKLFQLKKLNLYNNKIEKIPVMNFDTIDTMLFFANKITCIDGLSQSVLNRVTVISLYQNKITKLPVIQLSSLEKFYIYQNELQDIQELKNWKTPFLRILDMNSNKLKDVPSLRFPSLVELQLSYNKIESIQEFSTSSLPNLRKLFLNANPQLSKTNRLKDFEKLEQININECALQEFKNLSQSNLLHLRRLSLQKNKITNIPALNFYQIEELLLRENFIQSIEHNFSKMRKLKKLYLSSNNIKAINGEIFEDCVIEGMSLSKNPLQKVEFPQSFKLKNLTMTSCNLKDLNNVYLPHLQELILKNNQIKNLQFLNQPGAFSSLKRLHIEKNNIQKLPALDLPELKQIFIYNNPIQSVDEVLNSFLPNIRRILVQKSGAKSQINFSIKELRQRPIKFIESEDEDNNDSNSSDDDQKSNEGERISIKYMEASLQKQVSSQIQQTQKEIFLNKFKETFPKSIIKI